MIRVKSDLFIPSDRNGRLLLLLNFGLGALIYLWRTQLLDPYRHLALLDILFLFVCALSLGMLSLIYLVLRKRPLPLPVLIAGIVVASLLPVPPSPEERAFAAHRAEFEELVELARQRQLAPESPDGQCGAPDAFIIPTEYKYFIDAECLFAHGSQQSLHVEIMPFWYYDALIYSDRELQVDGPCADYHRDNITKQLDEHWYLCRRDTG